MVIWPIFPKFFPGCDEIAEIFKSTKTSFEELLIIKGNYYLSSPHVYRLLCENFIDIEGERLLDTSVIPNGNLDSRFPQKTGSNHT